MSLKTRALVLSGPAAREEAKRRIDRVPDGWEMDLYPPRKTREQERLFHALLPELARSAAVRERYGWHTVGEWKAELVKACFGLQVRPSFLRPGDYIVERISTRDLGKEQYADLIELTYATGAEAGHVWAAHRPGEEAA